VSFSSARVFLGSFVALIFVIAVGAPAAVASPPPAAPDLTALRAQVRAGTLLHDHGVTTSPCGACLAQVVTKAPGSKVPLSTSAPAGYGPAELAAAYHLPAPSVGAGGTIAIIDVAPYPTIEQDLAVYRSQYGLPACTVASGCLTVTDMNGGPPPAPYTNPDDLYSDEIVTLETALDVDAASAACPNCKLLLIELPLVDGELNSQPQMDKQMLDFGTAVNTAASMGASATSISWQFSSDLTVDNGVAGQDLFHPGMAVVAGSGDSTYEGSTDVTADHVGWPANLPWVVSAGGTALYHQGKNGYVNTAWWAAGSGCDSSLPPAFGQPAKVSALCAGHRATSDVSADANPATGIAMYDGFAPSSGIPRGWILIGGTSASSPFIAGLYARGGHTSQVMGPNTLYTARKGAFTDVTIGSNSLPQYPCPVNAQALCVSGTGWDGPTGVGVPNGLTGF
jgi:subtilase family serine protease